MDLAPMRVSAVCQNRESGWTDCHIVQP